MDTSGPTIAQAAVVARTGESTSPTSPKPPTAENQHQAVTVAKERRMHKKAIKENIMDVVHPVMVQDGARYCT